MKKNVIQACFQINKSDNVVTALEDIAMGVVNIMGDCSIQQIITQEPITKGHKIALSKIHKGEEIIKYGVAIGKAKKEICAGEWVHLHNCQSLYDERSSKLDIRTGVPHDTKYE